MQDVLNAAQLGSVYLLFALGMALAWGGTIGILNFAHGATFMFSAFVAHLVSQAFALPLPLALLISVLTGALISVATQVFAFQPIIHRSRNITTAETRILIGGHRSGLHPAGDRAADDPLRPRSGSTPPIRTWCGTWACSGSARPA